MTTEQTNDKPDGVTNKLTDSMLQIKEHSHSAENMLADFNNGLRHIVNKYRAKEIDDFNFGFSLSELMKSLVPTLNHISAINRELNHHLPHFQS